MIVIYNTYDEYMSTGAGMFSNMSGTHEYREWLLIVCHVDYLMRPTNVHVKLSGHFDGNR